VADMRVYIASSGQYSDYRILGVFSTKKIAEKFTLIYGDSGYGERNEVEEFEVDEHKNNLDRGLALFFVRWFSKAWREKSPSYDEWDCTLEEPTEEIIKPNWIKDGNVWTAHIWAKGKTHALKIASELKRQSIVETK